MNLRLAGVMAFTMVLSAATFVARAERDAVESQLPPWAVSGWRTFAASRHLVISPRLNPFLWRGDFDGDGHADLAVFVMDTAQHREGIAFLLQANPPVLIGAGIDFGNGGDDFSWMDYWYVDAPPDLHAAVDALVIGSESSASAVIAFGGGRPEWQQAGD